MFIVLLQQNSALGMARAPQQVPHSSCRGGLPCSLPAALASYLIVEETSLDRRGRLEGRRAFSRSGSGSTGPRDGYGGVGRSFFSSGVYKGWCVYTFKKHNVGQGMGCQWGECQQL